MYPSRLRIPAMLSFSFECGTLTSGNNALFALRIRVSISEMGSFIENYQLALVTPGMSPDNAASRKVIREHPNLRRYPWRRPLIEQRLTTRDGLALRGSLESPA